MMRCVQCDSELVAPVRSEYWSDKHACHVWLCPKCCARFSSIVSLPADTDTSDAMKDILTEDLSLFPSLLVQDAALFDVIECVLEGESDGRRRSVR